MPVKLRRLKEVPMEKNGTHKAMSTWIQSFLKLNIFCPESGEQFQSKAVSVTWFTGFVWTEGWFELKKIKIRFPEKYSDLRGASLKILSIKHTFLEITKVSLFLKYNVIYSTFTKDYFFSLFYSLIFSAVDPMFTTNCSQKYCP